MKFRSVLWILAFSAVCVFAATPTTIIGVVLESESDLPIKGVKITYRSGKVVGETNSDGRFEYDVDSKNASLVFSKDGYDSVFVDLQDFADLLDMVVSLVPNVRDLGSSTVIGGGEPVKWEPERTVKVESLEDAAGMRFDLTEHLSQMPGISGQKDFSSALYYEGSRAGDVAYHLGQLRIPNMRHLDVGFPGNLSVVNPHILSGIEIHDHYGSGPLGQGLATSVQYIPEQTPGDWGVKGAVGLTVQEVVLDMPWFFWDSFRISFRRLDPDMLKNLGEKFFTEFRKRDAGCDNDDDCRVKSSDPFDLSAYDVYAQLNGSDSLGDTWALRTLYSSDEYAIRQDTATKMDEVNSVNIISGEQEYLVLGAEYNSRFGTSVHAGFVREYLSDTLRDTTGFRNLTNRDLGQTSFIDGYEQVHSTISGGLSKGFNGSILGAGLSGAVLYEQQIIERSYPEFGGTVSDDYQTGVLSGSGRFDWNTDYSRYILSAGAVADAVDHNAQPTGSLDADVNLSRADSAYWHVFGNTAYRSDWKPYYDNGDLTGRLETGTSAKLGFGYRSKYFDGQVAGYGRYYVDPLLPMPKAFAYNRDVTPVDYAWSMGGGVKVEWKTSHHFSLSTNVNSVYGEYELEDGTSIPWEANARLDMLSHFRYYPRKDSVVSVILTHHALYHRPLYYYSVMPSSLDGENGKTSRTNGTRRLRDLNEFTDLYRTDVRVNLDITTSKYFFKNARFYLELDNIFAKLDVDALEFLGSQNARERSWVTQDNNDKTSDGYDLVPFMAKGMGMYFQFGVEVQLGI